MRETVDRIPDGSELIDSDMHSLEYEYTDTVELRRLGSDWYVYVQSSYGTCDLCGSETEDIDRFDNEAEAREFYVEARSRMW